MRVKLRLLMCSYALVRRLARKAAADDAQGRRQRRRDREALGHLGLRLRALQSTFARRGIVVPPRAEDGRDGAVVAKVSDETPNLHRKRAKVGERGLVDHAPPDQLFSP